MRNYFVFDNKDSRTYGVYISGSGTYNAPERSYEAIKVPGRNGDILIGGKKYDNIDLVYPAFIYANFQSQMADLRSALLSVNGYARLTDTYHPNEFRLAYFPGEIDVNARSQNDAGEFDLLFRCKPQRFLTSGETQTTISGSSGSITNPTLFNSKPIIRVNGYGTLTINGDQITIASGQSYVDINSEIQDCYYGTVNANSKVTFQSNEFPTLRPGVNNISRSGNITSVVITPNWYIL